MSATLISRPSMNCSANQRYFRRVSRSRTRAGTWLKSSTTDESSMPIEASSLTGFVIQRPAAGWGGTGDTPSHQSAVARPWARSQLLRQHLVARDHEPLGAAARVGDLQVVEEGGGNGHQLPAVVDGLHQVEHGVGRILPEPGLGGVQVQVDRQGRRLVPVAHQRSPHAVHLLEDVQGICRGLVGHRVVQDQDRPAAGHAAILVARAPVSGRPARRTAETTMRRISSS